MERFRLYIGVHLVTGIILFVFDYKSCQIVGSKFPVWFNEIFSAGFFSMQLAFASKSSLHCCTSIVGGRTTETKRFEALLKYQCKCHGMHGGRRMHPITDHSLWNSIHLKTFYSSLPQGWTSTWTVGTNTQSTMSHIDIDDWCESVQYPWSPEIIHRNEIYQKRQANLRTLHCSRRS